MESKFSHIEIDDQKFDVEHVFNYAIISYKNKDVECPERLTGLNMAIVLPCDEDGYHPVYEKGMDFYTVILCDKENNLRIPVEIHVGNMYSGHDFGYNKKTCCLFGYINPMMFDSYGAPGPVALAGFGSKVIGLQWNQL